MPDVVISDTSCLIAMEKLDAFHLLKSLYGEVKITSEIAAEFGKSLPEWFKIEKSTNKKFQKIIETLIDKGEASAIALALNYDNSLLILDDLKGRKFAVKLGLKITGTLGILYKCKQVGIIEKIKPFIDKLINSGFRLPEKVVAEILHLCCE